MNATLQIILATSFSLLITFTLYTITYERRANNSLFQHIVADTFHSNNLIVACFIDRQSMILEKNDFCQYNAFFVTDLTSCMIPHNKTEKLNRSILSICLLFVILLGYCYGSKIVFRLSYGPFVMANVWLLERWFSSFEFWYPVDKLTVYLVVWQFSYLILQWCSHQLSWSSLIFYQASVCILNAVMPFMSYDLMLRYFPTANIVLIWYACFNDV